jgi:DNA-binding GntR family transcriptional regulator
MAIIAALEDGDERRSRSAMRMHLEAMFERAFTDAIKDETAYLADVIAKYAISP